MTGAVAWTGVGVEVSDDVVDAVELLLEIVEVEDTSVGSSVGTGNVDAVVNTAQSPVGVGSPVEGATAPEMMVSDAVSMLVSDDPLLEDPALLDVD